MMSRLAAPLLAFAVFLAAAPAQAALVKKEIRYKDGETALTGYLVYDDAAKTPAPGVLVAHEWWGYNDYAKTRADDLAKLGYVAFALDMYGTGKEGATPDEASALSKPFYEDRALMRRRAMAGLKVLEDQPQVDKTRLGAVGYCFGGAVVLELARAGADLKGVVSFHGNLSTPLPAQKGAVKAEVLELGGAEDKFVSQDEKQAFAQEMKNAGVAFAMKDYKGATHAFTNPAATAMGEKFNLPIAYNAKADEESWQAMKAFFARLFGR
ncbi:MAG: alpha/beta hydrolase [Alphaproteobacteria bacterium]|nr:alpha/beta hydrolase [Alphaproteobacteria bacterium]